MIELAQFKVAMLAYIDPNTGTLVLQMIIASFVGAGVFFRRTIGRIFGWKRKNPPPDPEGENTKPQDPSPDEPKQ